MYSRASRSCAHFRQQHMTVSCPTLISRRLARATHWRGTAPHYKHLFRSSFTKASQGARWLHNVFSDEHKLPARAALLMSHDWEVSRGGKEADREADNNRDEVGDVHDKLHETLKTAEGLGHRDTEMVESSSGAENTQWVVTWTVIVRLLWACCVSRKLKVWKGEMCSGFR